MTFHVDIERLRESLRDRISKTWSLPIRRAVMGSAARPYGQAFSRRQRPLPDSADRIISALMTRTLLQLAKAARLGFWLCVMIILYLSLVPGTLRPHTGASGHLEHFIAYAGTAALFVPHASGRFALLGAAIGLSWLSGAVEIAQLWIPGRTGEIAGFIWSSAGAGLGLVIGIFVWRWLSQRA